MTKEEFLKKFTDILQTEETITLESVLDDLEDWDSLTTMATVSWLLENKIQITVKEIASYKTVGEIAAKFGVQ
ncbi:MAG: phosphopantetheine-binding protein [Treponema sp.]